MSTSALVVQQRHIALPECCLFRPSELQIEDTCTTEEFMQIGQALSAIDVADGLWQADFAAYAIRRWKDDGLAFAQEATNLTLHYLKRVARVAEVFPPSRRFSKLTKFHYLRLVPFAQKPELHTWLSTVAEQPHLSTRALYILACEKFGKPTTTAARCRSVNLPEALLSRLAKFGPSQKIGRLVEAILLDWLAQPHSPEEIAVIDAECRRQKHNENARRDRENLKEQRKADHEAEMRARRDKQEAEAAARKAERIAAKEKARADKEAERIKNKNVRGIEISLHGSCAIGKTSKWETHEEAFRAATLYEAVKKYPIEGFKCDKCGWFHIRCDEKRFAEAFERAKQRAREIKAHVGSSETSDPVSGYAGETRPNYAERIAR
jgi:hypothetical protein